MKKYPEIPKIGDKLYVGTSLYISRGSDDVAGGLATINKVDISKNIPIDHINAIMVSFKEVPGVGYNYKSLVADQKRLAKDYKGQKAHPDPDVDTPWIEDGDTVNGKPYKGSSIW